jgi:hypothetical protein
MDFGRPNDDARDLDERARLLEARTEPICMRPEQAILEEEGSYSWDCSAIGRICALLLEEMLTGRDDLTLSRGLV